MRTKTPSFILELPLKTSKNEEKELILRLESARKLYNAILGEAKNRVYLVKQSKIFRKAKKISKNTKDKKKIALRKELFQEAKDIYNFNEYSLHSYACELRYKLPNNLDVHTVQKLATRAFKATEKILFGTAKKVRFKGYNQFNSVESKSNVSGIRWRDNKVEWNKLSLEPIIKLHKLNDEVIEHSLKHRVKHSRIYRKIIKGKNRFYVQLILEGKAYIKDKNKLGKGTVCFDVGPSTVGIVSKNEKNKFNAKLLQFCSELDTKQKEITNLQRHIERQRRKNNPQNYLENGKIKKGRLTWEKSKRQKENQKKLKELHRAISSHRKSLHGKLANETLRMGNVFKTEKISKKWLQKNYGKSIGIRAPAMYTSILNRKAESAGGSFMEFATQTTKLSQTCVCGKQIKKKLSDRVHSCECGVYCQRDLFSAFLGIFVEKVGKPEKEEKYILQADQAEKCWSSADKLLRTAWQDSTQSASRGVRPSSFGTKSQSQSGSFAEMRIADLKVQDVVAGFHPVESLKASEAFPLEPTGF